jgi:hypothetical protein
LAWLSSVRAVARADGSMRTDPSSFDMKLLTSPGPSAPEHMIVTQASPWARCSSVEPPDFALGRACGSPSSSRSSTDTSPADSTGPPPRSPMRARALPHSSTIRSSSAEDPPRPVGRNRGERACRCIAGCGAP